MSGCAETSAFSVSALGGIDAIRELLSDLCTQLDAMHFDAESLGAFEIVLVEALNNVCEHAYVNGPGPFKVTCASKQDGLHISIVDNGKPMPNNSLPVGDHPMADADPDDLPEGGFGWFLIYTLAEDVTYSRAENQNILSLRMAIHPTNT